MPPMKMQHDRDPAEVLIEKLGDLSAFELANNNVLTAIYDRPKTTASGITLPDNYLREEEFQGKAVLIVKLGPTAFEAEAKEWFNGIEFKLHDWVAMRPSDGWSIAINGVKCRVYEDIQFKMKIPSPDSIW